MEKRLRGFFLFVEFFVPSPLLYICLCSEKLGIGARQKYQAPWIFGAPRGPPTGTPVLLHIKMIDKKNMITTFLLALP